MTIADRPLTHIPTLQLNVADVALPTQVQKRDGREVAFEPGRITSAIDKCFKGIKKSPYTSVDDLTSRVLNTISTRGGTWSVEGIQDVVEMTLAGAGEFEAAKAYILYRAEHAKLRNEQPIPDEVRALFDQSAEYFPTQLQQFQFYDKYSRWNDELGRRETWPETVERSVSFLKDLVGEHVDGQMVQDMARNGTWKRIRDSIIQMRAMPSMRLLAMAGPAAKRQNASIYNCCFVPADCVAAFVETLLLSMSGCGVGYSVERRHIDELPAVTPQREGIPVSNFIVEDSTEGWGEAVRTGMTLWFEGYDVKFDCSLVRPAGTPLKTKGGRASGPDPLINALAFIRERILSRQGSRLRPLDAHDMMCMIGNAAVSGGVRRTALISLFDIDDVEMANCKVGDFETHNSQRWNANNSAVIPEEGISETQFLNIWHAMIASERGEPGFISRQAMRNTMPSRREWDADFGMNPCAEIVLKPMEMCNLSIAVARNGDSFDTLADKVEVAAIIGTIQSLATHFPGLRPQWAENARKERLLGVDITGQRDCPTLQDSDVMRDLKYIAVETNRKLAAKFGIKQSAAVTTVKPNGNSSVLLDSASGLHPRWAPFYERNVRVSATSPIYKVLRDAGVPLSPELGQESMPEPYCVSVDTRVLTDDFRWVPAGDLVEGDGIIGFDEDTSEGKRRRMQRATVTHASRRTAGVYKIVLQDGTVLRSTPEHRWLASTSNSRTKWIRTDELLEMHTKGNLVHLNRYFEPTSENESRESGYLAGLFDGEGCLTMRPDNFHLGVSQNDGVVLNTALAALESQGYRVAVGQKSGTIGTNICRSVDLRGGRPVIARFLSEIRPVRLIKKAIDNIDQWSLAKTALLTIASIVYEPECEIAVLSSSTKTYFAEGFGAHNTYVASFVVKAPEGTPTRADLTALDQLNYWLHNRKYWTEHNPSVTCQYRPDEIISLMAEVWKNREWLVGMSFLPYSDVKLAKLPYREISAEEYKDRAAAFPQIDFSRLIRYEGTDMTVASQELACVGGNCEV